MRYFGLLLCVFFSGCYASSASQIQQHLEKHDPWVADFFHPVIDFWDADKFEKKYKKSCFSPAGNYGYTSERITLHPPDGDRWEQTIGILDHELVHLLFDFMGKQKGPFARKKIKGPGYTAMNRYMKSRVNQAVFDPIRTDIQARYPEHCHKKWFGYLHRGEEVMGRMVDSLYSLYFGPYDYKYFPLTREDIAFLAKYTYQGEPLFRKGIERYRIGMQMHEMGIAPSIIQHKLEFAEKFKYRGQKYHWPKLEKDFRPQIKF